MSKKYINKDVYQTSLERFRYLFANFDNVLVAFSGGKDNSVCLEMAYDFAKQSGQLEKLNYFSLDYEAQYQDTTDFIEETFDRINDVNRYLLCLPIKAECCCSHDRSYWIPWDQDDKGIWVRNMPEDEYIINENNCPFAFEKGTQDYKLQANFSKWFASKHGKTAVVIGIRADESLHRYSAVSRNDKVASYEGLNWATKISNEVINVYPIYDWTAEDDFIYFGKFNKPYNKVYDLFYKAGLKPYQMRVASPFNFSAGQVLGLYKALNPNIWGKMIARVNGANFVALYGNTKAMAFKSVTKPDGLSWKQYAEFLLSTLDEETRNHYLKKLNTSIEFWKKQGGGLDDLTIAQLKKETKIKVVGRVSNQTDKQVVRIDEYLDDTNATQFNLIPTYKRFCICILKNDWNCIYMGFGRTKSDMDRRKKALERIASL